jgi:hypothetical protein
VSTTALVHVRMCAHVRTTVPGIILDSVANYCGYGVEPGQLIEVVVIQLDGGRALA